MIGPCVSVVGLCFVFRGDSRHERTHNNTDWAIIGDNNADVGAAVRGSYASTSTARAAKDHAPPGIRHKRMRKPVTSLVRGYI